MKRMYIPLLLPLVCLACTKQAANWEVRLAEETDGRTGFWQYWSVPSVRTSDQIVVEIASEDAIIGARYLIADGDTIPVDPTVSSAAITFAEPEELARALDLPVKDVRTEAEGALRIGWFAKTLIDVSQRQLFEPDTERSMTDDFKVAKPTAEVIERIARTIDDMRAVAAQNGAEKIVGLQVSLVGYNWQRGTDGEIFVSGLAVREGKLLESDEPVWRLIMKSSRVNL